MRKRLLVFLLSLFVASVFSTTASAAPGSKRVVLLSTEYQSGGIVLIFETSGLTNADLKNAYVYANSQWYKMYCKYKDDTTNVRCSFTKKLAGQGNFAATLGGFAFWGTLPEAKEIIEGSGPAPLCPAGQTAIYHLDATCSHGIHVTYNIFVSSGGNLADVVQAEVNLWASFSDPITVNSVTFVGCQP